MNIPHLPSHRRRAFTLIEVLVVIAIASLLASLLYPVFLSVQGQARQAVCASNLRQIGFGIALYQQDYDGLFPRAVNPADRAAPEVYRALMPSFADEIPRIGLLPEVLQPYTKTPQIFSCPADTGFEWTEYPVMPLQASPSGFQQFGISYAYRSAFAACQESDASITSPSKIGLLVDPVGFWHGTLLPIAPGYNLLFADGHVKNIGKPDSDAFLQGPAPREGC